MKDLDKSKKPIIKERSYHQRTNQYSQTSIIALFRRCITIDKILPNKAIIRFSRYLSKNLQKPKFFPLSKIWNFLLLSTKATSKKPSKLYYKKAIKLIKIGLLPKSLIILTPNLTNLLKTFDKNTDSYLVFYISL